MKITKLILGILIAAASLHAQDSTKIPWRILSIPPPTCNIGEVYWDITLGGPKTCTATNTWSVLSSGGGGGVTIPATRNIMVGDGAGGLGSIIGPGNCLGGLVSTGISATGVANCITPTTATLGDLVPVRTNSTTLTLTCAPCGTIFGNVNGTATVSNTGGLGTAVFWLTGPVATPTFHVGVPAAAGGVITASCGGFNCSGSETATSIPATGAIPIGSWTSSSVAGQWDVGGFTEGRKFIGGMPTPIANTASCTSVWAGWDVGWQLTCGGGGATMQSFPYWFQSADGAGRYATQGITVVNSPFSVNGVSSAGGLSGFETATTSASTYVVIHHMLPSATRDGTSGWDGSAINMNLTWGNSQGGSGNVQVQVSSYCVANSGSSATPTFTNTVTTQLTVPAGGNLAITQLSVPLGSCVAGNIMFIKLLHVLPGSYTGTGSAYGSGIDLYGVTLLVKQ